MGQKKQTDEKMAKHRKKSKKTKQQKTRKKRQKAHFFFGVASYLLLSLLFRCVSLLLALLFDVLLSFAFLLFL